MNRRDSVLGQFTLKKVITFFALATITFLALISVPVGAQTQTADAVIESLDNQPCPTNPEQSCQYADLIIEEDLIEGVLLREKSAEGSTYETFNEGDIIIVSEVSDESGNIQYNYLRPKRTVPYIFLISVFLLIIIVIGGFKGVRSVVSLIFSAALIFGVMLPMIVEYPQQLLLIGLMTAFLIYVLNQLIGHGPSKDALISIFGGAISFVFVFIISLGSATLFKLSGFGDDGVLFVSQLLPNEFNFGDLFIVGIMFGLAGAVDDVTTTQSATVAELVDVQSDIAPKEVYKKAMNVGTSHMVSMVNTLFLAYFGAALPTMILFALLNESAINIIGRDDITEEILRTILASLGLLIAIPLTTWLAVYLRTDKKKYSMNQRLFPF